MTTDIESKILKLLCFGYIFECQLISMKENELQIKICCISSLAEAELAIEYGANILGLVGPMPSGPGIVDNTQIARISASIQSPIKTFLLTSETTFEGIVRHHAKVNTTSIQICDYPDPDVYHRLKIQLRGIEIIQVIHVTDQSAVHKALEYHENVHALLLDSGSPNAAVKTLDGTGQVHNWDISRSIVEVSRCPVFLAGGLNPGNVSEAIRLVNPDGVDLCSGVRTNNRLDPVKLRHFIQMCRNTTQFG